MEPPPPEARSETQAPESADKGREEERGRMTPLRRTIARRLVEARQSMALLTTFNDWPMLVKLAFTEAPSITGDKAFNALFNCPLDTDSTALMMTRISPDDVADMPSRTLPTASALSFVLLTEL